MNKAILKLCHLKSIKSRLVIGLMSGTSLDGLDIALVRFEDQTKPQLLKFKTIPYSKNLKNSLKLIASQPIVDLQSVCLWNTELARHHAKMILNTLKQWKIKPSQIHLIGSHGHTIFHAPKHKHKLKNFSNSTLQIVDGNHLATLTQITTCCDFRQKDIALGNEGAPLAIYGDYFMASSKTENRILLNIGGVGNFTYLPANLKFKDTFCTDTGPGNCLLDAYCQKYCNVPFDKNGALAKSGTLNKAWLNAMLKHDFFKQKQSKSTGLEAFNLDWLMSLKNNYNLPEINHVDMLHTLTELSAVTIVKGIEKTVKGQYEMYCSGGGFHNTWLMERIKKHLNLKSIKDCASLGLPADAKEAMIFACLAHELIMGNKYCEYGKICLP
ncbi:MAG: anhydro-N-acetylmuramic acid kinase [Alphaproteobacteria bacterium]|nr:anhydro-N-acetylmuramic acid kinase [Alphaproteobacteria bacterium]